MPAPTELEHPAMGDVALTDVLFALSDPSRLAIARQLVDGPMDMAACSATGGPVPKATKSHQLRVLREAGVVRNVPKGRGRLLSLRRDELDDAFPGLVDSVLVRPADTAGVSSRGSGRPRGRGPGLSVSS